MIGKNRFSRWLVLALLLTVAEGATLLALTVPAQAQFRDDRFPFLSRQRPSQGGGFFGGLFGPSSRPSYRSNDPFHQPQPQYREPQYRADDSRAPAARKPDPNEQVAPTTSIVVMGDGMADWLAYGLEDAFSDSPEVAIIRKNKLHSGLFRYEAKSDLDWWHVARDILAQEKPSYVVMMLGIADRQNIRERDLPKEDPKAKDDNKAKGEPNQSAQNADKTDDNDQAMVAPEPSRTKKTSGVIEFRSDRWAEIYSKRVDDTIAALKSKGVPVFWVGLPSIRGQKSTADAVYLNDLYRARAQRAGAVYVDVWEGFVDETGKFSSYGPDYEGQMRRLRSNDGVYFTKFGARKIAHYVERELRRFMSNRATPVALPTGPVGPAPDSKSPVRPVAGPVVPLTASTGNTDEQLLGGSASQPMHSDALANRVLVKGEPVAPPAGRADDFALQTGTESRASAPVTAAPAAPNEPASAAPRNAPATTAPQQPKRGPTGTTAQTTGAKPRPGNSTTTAAPRPAQQRDVPRPPAPIRQSNSPFGWFR